ncbi:hypothetical protein [Streptomyces sp. NPDC093589]|uniref:hypothetical protein n=1 Tax=Streptomyces sp. NPDC093589 TaxID=3366043 RepID=UPI00381C2E76
MSEGFRVDLGALEKAAEGVNATLNDLKEKKVSDLDGDQGDFGHEQLAETVSDFCDRWELGIEHLAKDGQEVAFRLSKSVQNYMEIDAALKGHLDGILERHSGRDPGVH